MTGNQELERELVRLGKAIAPDGAFVEGVMRRVERSTIVPREGIYYGRWIMRAGIGLAASIAIVLGIWFATLGGAAPAYAQVQESLRNARSLHAVSYTWQDGKWVHMGDMWFQRDVGFAATGTAPVEGKLPGVKFALIDDGKSTIEWSEGRPPTSRPTRMDVGGMLAAQLNLAAFEQRPQREPEGDRVINGAKCRLFVQKQSDGKGRSRLWIDDSNWVRRVEIESLSEGKWRPHSAADVEYNIAVDPARFKLDLGDQSASPEQTRRRLFDRALSRANRLGLEFAVHEVKRVEGGLIYALCSIRPSEQTTREFGQTKWGMYQQLCDFQLGMIWNPEDGKSRDFVPWRMASMNPGPLDADGIYAEWVILVPRGNWPQPLRTWEVSAHIYARGPWAEKLQKDGKEWWAKFDHLGSVEVPADSVSLEWVAKAVYEDARALTTTLTSRVDLWNAVKRSSDGTAGSKAMTVNKITHEEFLEQVRRAIKDVTKPIDPADAK